jgi:hypothetical protein
MYRDLSKKVSQSTNVPHSSNFSQYEKDDGKYYKFNLEINKKAFANQVGSFSVLVPDLPCPNSTKGKRPTRDFEINLYCTLDLAKRNIKFGTVDLVSGFIVGSVLSNCIVWNYKDVIIAMI